MSKTQQNLSGACPTFFRASCRRASDGSTEGYQWAGYGLIGAVAGLAPDGVEEGDWLERVVTLEFLIIARDDGAVLEWLDIQLPRCMALVPGPRRGAFLRGIYRAVIEEEKGLLD